MNSEERKKLDRICNPRALAVFGGVGKFGSFANLILLSHLKYGYKGSIYPISNNGSEVAGLKIYKSLKEVGEPVDLASIAVPATSVPEVLRDCLEYGVTGAQVHTAGFSETGGRQGAAIEKEMEQIAQRGLMIIGPNCFGIHCPRGGITLLPGFDYSKEPGPLGMISQSGGIANDFTHETIQAGINVSKVISYGNGCDLEAVKLLEYLSEDPDTEFIAAYLEGVKDGRLFLETIRQVAAKKPVVIWKGGLTPLGSKATMSHTGSLGGEAKTWEGALTQAGAISVQGLDEMMDTLTALKFLKNRGKRIAFAGGGGAIGVFSSDMAYRWGLEVPPFSQETQNRLTELFPTPGNSVLNPLDTGTPALPLKIFGPQIKEILTRESIDVLVLIMLLHALEAVPKAICTMRGFPLPKEGQYLEDLLEIISPLKKETGKDIVLVMENRTYNLEDTYIEGIARKMRKKFQQNGIPVYPNSARALTGIRNASRINFIV
jgi:acyl-CoA synthetase (NDP forming)